MSLGRTLTSVGNGGAGALARIAPEVITATRVTARLTETVGATDEAMKSAEKSASNWLGRVVAIGSGAALFPRS